MVCFEMFKNIRFNPDSISSCSTNCSGPYIDILNNLNIDKKYLIDKYIEKIKSTYEQLKNNINIPNSCNNCYALESNKYNPQENNVNLSISCIDIAHWYKCNVNCVYCCYDFNTKQKYVTSYNVLDYIKYLKNYINEDCMVKIGGGEPGVLENISDILNFFYEFKNSHIFIMSNLVIWKKEYEKLLNENRLSFTTSLDCANRFLYKKIKQKDYYDEVIKNIQKVISYQKNTNLINLKYIIIENINDTEQNINEFIDLIDSLGVKVVSFSFDRNSYNIGKKIPGNIVNLYNYAKELAVKKNLNLDIDDRCEAMVKSLYYI